MRFATPVPALVAVLAMLLATAPAASAARCTGAKASASQVSKKKLVRATLCVLNAERRKRGLRPLRLDKRLSRAARMHSRAMARNSFFSHDSQNGSTFVERIRRSGYLRGARSWTVGENIAWGSGSRSAVGSIARAWINSPGHRANILSRSYRHIGIGISYGTPSGGGDGATYTTDFGARS